MSKSEPSDLSRINMTDDADTIVKKIRKAKTDPAPLPETLDELKGRPEAENLVGIYAALSDRSRQEVIDEYRRPAVLGRSSRRWPSYSGHGA
jgi:tryptophanyl-tRNA synthetase